MILRTVYWSACCIAMMFALGACVSTGVSGGETKIEKNVALDTAPATPFRTIHVSRQFAAPITQVWKDWTTVQGQEKFFGGKVALELKTNGRHDIWFLPDAPKGQRGHEDGRILAAEEPTLFSFTWTMPPYMPEIRPHHTFVQMHFEQEGDNLTTIHLAHTGFGSDKHWDQGYEYFVTTWPQVFDAYAKSMSDNE